MKYFNVGWFIGCIVTTALFAYACQSLIPVVTSSLSPDGISHGIYDLLSRSKVVQISCGIALFGVFFSAICMGGLVLIDTVAMYRFQQYLKSASNNGKADGAIKGRDLLKVATDNGDLERPVAEYVAASRISDNKTFSAAVSAERFFSFDTQVRSRLNLWFFDSLPWILMCCGIVLLFLGAVIGIDDMLFRSMLSAQQPVSGLLSTLQTGIFALAICMMSAIVARIIVTFFTNLRRAQTARFTSLLDSLFLVSSGGSHALQQSLKTLSDAQVLIAEDRSAQMAKVIDSALKKLTDTLMGEFQSQVKSTSKLLEETEKQVTKSSVAIQAAHDALAKYARGQSAAIDKAIGATLGTHLKDEEKARAGMADAVTKAMGAVQKNMDKSAQSSTDIIEQSLKALGENYGVGLKDTAENLQKTQSEIARLVVAVEMLSNRAAATSSAPSSPAKEEYLRLVGDDDPIHDAPPLGIGDLGDDEEENEERVDRLTKALKLGGSKPVKDGKKGKSDKRLTSALNDIKKGSQPSDLPDL